MALVFDNFAAQVAYPDETMLSTMSAMATQSVVALKDSQGVAADLTLGATSNLQLEAVDTVNIFTGDGKMSLYKTVVDSSNLRTDTLILNVSEPTEGVARIQAGDSNIISLVPADAAKTTQVGDLTVSDDVQAEEIVLTTGAMSNGVRLEGALKVEGYQTVRDSLTVGANAWIGGHSFVNGNSYSKNYNLWKNSNDGLVTAAASKVGYSLIINDRDQLEIVKYGEFSNQEVYKKVAVFGTQSLSSNDGNEGTYMSFDALTGISVVNNDGSSNIVLTNASQSSGTLASTSNLNLYSTTLGGQTTVSGHILPSQTLVYDLGSSNLRFRDLYLSGNTIDMDGVVKIKASSNGIEILDGNNQKLKVNGVSMEQVQTTAIDTSDATTISGSSNVHILQNGNLVPGATWAACVRNDVQLSGYSSSQNTAVDSNGNVYVAFNYNNRISTRLYNKDGSLSPVMLPQSSGNYGTAIVKYDSAGNVVFATAINQNYYFGISIDSSDNYYVATNYGANQSPIIYNSTGLDSGLTAVRAESGTGGHTNSMITKFNSSGIAQWYATVSKSEPFGVTADNSSGAVYLMGRCFHSYAGSIYSASPALNTFVETLPTPLGTQNYLIKFSSSGEFIWKAIIDGGADQYGWGVGVDKAGNPLVTGLYSSTGTVYHSNGSNLATNFRSPNGVGGFVVKYSSAGIAQWFSTFDGGWDHGMSVDADSENNVYVAGVYEGGASMYNMNNSNIATLRTATGAAALLAKFSPTGSNMWWASIDGTGEDKPINVKVDPSDFIYMGGHSHSNVTIFNTNNSASALSLGSISDQTAWIVRYNSAGTAQNAVRVDGVGNNSMTGLAIDANYNVYAAGSYTANNLPTIYRPDGTASGLSVVNGTSGNSMFLVKYMMTNTPPVYKLLTTPYTSSNNGQNKTFINTSSTSAQLVVTTGSSNLSTHTISAYSSKNFMWYNDRWFAL